MRRWLLPTLVIVTGLSLTSCQRPSGVACAPMPEAEESSQGDVLASSRLVLVERMQMCYADWRTFHLPIAEEALCDYLWDYKLILRFPALDLDRLRAALAGTRTRPLHKAPHDFTLICAIELAANDGRHETLQLSFAKYPLSVRLNGAYFEPSEELLALMSEFLPYEAARAWREMGPILGGGEGT